MQRDSVPCQSVTQRATEKATEKERGREIEIARYGERERERERESETEREHVEHKNVTSKYYVHAQFLVLVVPLEIK